MRTLAFPLCILATIVLLAAVIVLSILVGANPVPVHAVLDAVRGNGSNEANYVIWTQRVPRTVAGLMVGAALSVAGALVQSYTRNPLADTGLLGVNAGAAFFVAVGIAFFGISSPAGYVWLACLGALVLTAVVYTIGSAGGETAGPVRLTMAGVALGAVLSGLTTGLTLTNPDAFERMRGWSAGSLLERDFSVLLPVLPFLICGVVIAALVAPGLNSISLGSDVARSQGVDIRRTQAFVLVAVTLLAGGATAIAGPLVFVGLVVPHIVRWAVGVDQRKIVMGSLLFGPCLVLLSDIVGRIAVPPSEMPVGVVTAFVGAPLLIGLVRRAKATGL
ncbi:iron complex transport system permease protein [Devosia sp. YR412]|uniref:iron chelate uptake ABC transporter family permease subunit n=1 Tax=Devosia sp. YR412 TaxID=1881030 RepID=UPI0008B8956C|nr:iron chelate uptake ABC transporter family permease subunit [Devosia sp. YR412]SEQ37844.1 iron complex transport system permease protein [Devosia sp. YR412]